MTLLIGSPAPPVLARGHGSPHLKVHEGLNLKPKTLALYPTKAQSSSIKLVNNILQLLEPWEAVPELANRP